MECATVELYNNWAVLRENARRFNGAVRALFAFFYFFLIVHMHDNSA